MDQRVDSLRPQTTTLKPHAPTWTQLSFLGLLGPTLRTLSPLQVLCFLVPFIIPLPIMGLGLFAGALQP